MSEEAVTAKPQRRWFFNPWMMAAISLATCVVAATVERLCHFTLEPLTISLVGMTLAFPGSILGVAWFLLVVCPFQLLVMLFARRRRLKVRTTCLLMLIPTAYIACDRAKASYSWKNPTPANEHKRFEGITGMPWPGDAKMLLAEHGWGFQDRRHIWLFEGTPEQFEKLVHAHDWVLEDPSSADDFFKWMPIEKAAKRFSEDSPWRAEEVYFWMANKFVEKGPYGPGNLITDKEHRRWCVWWDAI